MNSKRRGELEKIALDVRKDVVLMLGLARVGGIPKVLRVVNVLVFLYWEYMKVFPAERKRDDRDRLVMGNGAAAPALYACLARRGYFGRDELWNYGRLGAVLQGYPDIRTPGIDAPWCSHGGCAGVASAMADFLSSQGNGARVFCVADEEEMRSGVSWESVISSTAAGCRNFALIAESNGTDDFMGEGLRAFGWKTAEARNDFESLFEAFSGLDFMSPPPKAVIVRTEDADYGDMPLTTDEVDNVLSGMENETAGGGFRV
ncbi:MAG: transketolase [Synergistaceae bacterium]|jgi:transketolase|nr:transketolase [Synergistaceae bacterium]